MAKSIFKILTFIALQFAVSLPIFAAVLDQTELKTHLRWKINVEKEQVQIKKTGNKVIFKSLDPEFFNKLSTDITKIKQNRNYHTKFKFSSPRTPGMPYILTLELKDESIELFNFYKKDKSQYVLDYWINQDIVATRNASISIPKKIAIPKKKVIKKIVKKPSTQKILTTRKADKFKIINPAKVAKKKETPYRDFRYGAAFVWDYPAVIPSLEKDLDLAVKAPDYVYKILDRRFKDNKKEAHIQLNINFYNQQKWGLMTRSITLYEKTYGIDKFKALNDFMKATSMIKNVLKEKVTPKYSQTGEEKEAKSFSKKGILASARGILTNSLDRTRDYNLAKGILRYLIQYARDENDSINALEYAKKLYVKASSAYDDDMIAYSSRVILNSLANLKQHKKVKDFLENKAVKRVLSKQEGLAYTGFIHLHQGNTKKLLSEFKKFQKSLIKPIHPSILFNTAEAYFREAMYSEAIKLFDNYVAAYSFSNESSHARLRIALSYDLNNGDPKKILRLYKDAINKSSDLAIRYEAKLRYVGFRAVRKRNLDDSDKETLSFTEASIAEKKLMTTKLQKLLWLVRLRSFINTQKFDEALAYITTLPLDSIKLIEKRTFEADGAEVVLGIIQKAYLAEDYARAVKIWEVYKDKYETKVAKSPYMAFIVSDSFLKLGLISSFERSLKRISSLTNDHVRAFPRWVDPHKEISIRDYMTELSINKYLQNDDYQGLGDYLEQHKKNKNINYKYYNGLVSSKLRKYNKSVTSFESILVAPNQNNHLTPKQTLIMFENYLESLYQTGPAKRFRKNAAALSNDLRLNANKNTKDLLERISYLYVESLFAEKEIDYKLLSNKTSEFLKEHSESSYENRISFLSGISKINIGNVEAGKKILNSMIMKEGVPEYLKGLARSELSTLAIEGKRI